MTEMLNPYSGPPEEIQPLTGEALRREVEFYKRTADQNGEPYDPAWEQWLIDDAQGIER